MCYGCCLLSVEQVELLPCPTRSMGAGIMPAPIRSPCIIQNNIPGITQLRNDMETDMVLGAIPRVLATRVYYPKTTYYVPGSVETGTTRVACTRL